MKSADLSEPADWRRAQSIIEHTDPPELPAPSHLN